MDLRPWASPRPILAPARAAPVRRPVRVRNARRVRCAYFVCGGMGSLSVGNFEDAFTPFNGARRVALYMSGSPSVNGAKDVLGATRIAWRIGPNTLTAKAFWVIVP